MAVLPSNSDIFSVVPSTGASKKIPAPSHAAVAAIAAGRTPPASNKPAIRRMSSVSSAAANRKANPEKRANHNAIERARRDTLNQRFLVLASKLPSISEVRRPSKSLIVNRSLQFVTESLSREAMYRKMATELHERTRVLTEQLNEYRIANGLQNFVETVPELVLPIAQADVPKDKPSARVLARKESTSTSIDDMGDELDDGLFPLDQFTDEPADMQQGYQMGIAASAPALPYGTPSQLGTDVSFFPQSLRGSPATATSSPSSHTDPAVQSPGCAGSPTDPTAVMHPLVSSVPHPETGMFNPMFLDGGMFGSNQFGSDFSAFLAPSAFPSA